MPDPSQKQSDILGSAPQSEPTLRAVAMPADTNPHGDIFGGWLLCQMDLAGTIVATRRALGRVVTVAITAMSFDRPVLVGDEVTCFCNIEKVGNTSITIHVAVEAERFGTPGVVVKVTEAEVTFVAIGENREKVKIGK